MISQKKKKKEKARRFFDYPFKKSHHRLLLKKMAQARSNSAFVARSELFPFLRVDSSPLLRQQEDTAAMEQIADAIMQIPPNAIGSATRVNVVSAVR